MINRFLTLLTIGSLAGVTVAYASTRSATTADAIFQKVHLAAKKPASSSTKASTGSTSSSKTKAPSKAKSSTASKSTSKKTKDPVAIAKPPVEQRAAKQQVADLTTTQKSKMLVLLNEGSAKDLSAIRGISSTRAAAIEKARPFKSIDEVVLVRGIGKTTFGEVIEHARSLTRRRSSSSSSSKTAKTSKSSSSSKS